MTRSQRRDQRRRWTENQEKKSRTRRRTRFHFQEKTRWYITSHFTTWDSREEEECILSMKPAFESFCRRNWRLHRKGDTITWKGIYSKGQRLSGHICYFKYCLLFFFYRLSFPASVAFEGGSRERVSLSWKEKKKEFLQNTKWMTWHHSHYVLDYDSQSFSLWFNSMWYLCHDHDHLSRNGMERNVLLERIVHAKQDWEEDSPTNLNPRFLSLSFPFPSLESFALPVIPFSSGSFPSISTLIILVLKVITERKERSHDHQETWTWR